MAEVFKITPTPHPSRMSFRVEYPTALIRDGGLPNVGDLYRDLSGMDSRRVTEEGTDFGWGDYTYADQEKCESDGFIVLTYVRPNTPEDIANPKPFRSFWSNEESVSWPPVLEQLPSGRIIDFTQDNSFPFYKTVAAGNTEISTPRILVNYALRKQYDGPTSVRTDFYLSSVPWGPNALEVKHPQPNHVYWNQTSTSEDLGFCLHDTIVIPAFGAVASTTSGVTSNTPPATEGKILPATNYIGWTDRRISATQEYVNGLWIITIKTAKAPKRMDIVQRLQ
jgi:hypothetical protein